MGDIGRWLEEHDLGQFAELFLAEQIRIDDLPDLTEDDLRELGLPMGPRKRLLRAAASIEVTPSGRLPSPEPQRDADRSRQSLGAERRQLTVMFCDLVGSVELGGRMDVEDYRDVLTRFREAVVAAITRFDGFIARHQGDGVLAYFGYPQAHESDAERAVKGALEVLDAVRRLEHPYDIEVDVRVGIATGPAVVGDVLATGASDRSELAALGPTPNLAARLQGQADPGTVVISETTRALVAGFFSVEPLTPRSLKGLGETPLFRVVEEARGRSRFEARTGGRLSPFLGRREELEILDLRWRDVSEGCGQVVVAVGEAGIGKSRLAEQFRLQTSDAGAEVRVLQCSPFFVNSALHPVIDWLEREVATVPNEQTSTDVGRIERYLVDRRLVSDEATGLLAHLLLTNSELRLPHIESLDPDERRLRLLTLLEKLLLGGASALPALAMVEDVHWADPSTLELLSRCVEGISRRPAMLLLTARPEFTASWTDFAEVRVLILGRLANAACESLAQSAAGTDGLTDDLRSRIVSRAAGNPLFIEELTRSVVESGADIFAGSDLSIPATLRDSLTARLDALTAGREVAQVASVLGRTFSLVLLERVWSGDRQMLREGLEELQQVGLVHRRSGDTADLYQFKHALVEDTAYGTLLRDTRRSLHARVASALRTRQLDADPVLLAHHYTGAGMALEAVECWERAGNVARARSNNVEAVNHFRMGLDLLGELDSEERPRHEILLQASIGQALLVIEGYSASAPRVALERARVLCEEVGDQTYLPTILQGLWRNSISVPDFAEANRISNEMLEVADRSDDGPASIVAHHFLGASLLWSGDPKGSLTHTERAISLYESEPAEESLFRVGTDPKGNALGNAAWAMWLLGYPEQALRRSAEAVGYASETRHAYSLAVALSWSSIIHHLCRDVPGSLRDAAQCIELCEERGFVEYAASASVLKGWGMCFSGDQRNGYDAICDGMAKRRGRGAGLFWPFFCSLRARVLSAVGKVEEAIQVIDEGLSAGDKGGERWCEPELLRLKAEFTHELGFPGAQSSACELLERSLSKARQQAARSWELRTAVSLACLAPGRRADVLEEVYLAFEEGFDLPDLIEARQLMDNQD